jgi:hypothetical protein
MTDFQTIDDSQLQTIHGGAEDTMGPTALVNGHPYTRAALLARGQQLFDHGSDPKISNELWMRQYRRLDDAYQSLPSH